MRRWIVMLPASFLVSILIAGIANAAPTPKTIANPGTAIELFRNSHSTAIAAMVKYHGLQKPNESNRTLVATCWMYAQYCECNKPGKPMLWRIEEGLKKMFAGRGYPNTAIKERARYARNTAETAGWEKYTEAINGNRPVLLTFCYDAQAKGDLTQAKRRVGNCTSVLGIGYVTSNGKHYLICHDGMAGGQAYPASVDRVSAGSIGLSTNSGVWSQAGTSIYKWDGAYTNLVMVFTGKPTK